MSKIIVSHFIKSLLECADSDEVKTLLGLAEFTIPPACVAIALGSSTADAEAGTAVESFRMPFGMTLSDIRVSLAEAPTGSVFEIDVKASGVTVFSTNLTVDDGETTSVTALIPAVISTSVLTNNEEITVDIIAVGSTTPGKGAKVYLIGDVT